MPTTVDFISTDDAHVEASRLVSDMVKGEKERLGCLARAIYAVTRSIPEATKSKIEKLNRGEKAGVGGALLHNIRVAHTRWLETYEGYLNGRQRWIEERQAELEAMLHGTSDPSFYEGQFPEIRRPSPERKRLGDQEG